MSRIARATQAPARRCLIVERHDWETGGSEQQLQFVLEVARQFFGPGTAARAITVNVYLTLSSAHPTFSKQIGISKEYLPSGTRRTNGFPEMGAVPSSFVFFEETDTLNTYDVWWQVDKAIVAAHFPNWSQGKNSQHGRGRLSIIVPAPVPRPIDRI